MVDSSRSSTALWICGNEYKISSFEGRGVSPPCGLVGETNFVNEVSCAVRGIQWSVVCGTLQLWEYQGEGRFLTSWQGSPLMGRRSNGCWNAVSKGHSLFFFSFLILFLHILVDSLSLNLLWSRNMSFFQFCFGDPVFIGKSGCHGDAGGLVFAEKVFLLPGTPRRSKLHLFLFFTF